MAVQSPVLVGGYWTYLRIMGSTHLNPTDRQIHNAYQFRSAMLSDGWSELAIAGMLGNIQVESGISPGALQKPSICPNNAESLSDVPNSWMINNYFDSNDHSTRGYGIGLIQWDGYTDQAIPNGPQLVSYAIRNNLDWYNGTVQTSRIEYEYQHDTTGGNIPVPSTGRTYEWWRVRRFAGIDWYYSMYKIVDDINPSLAADIFRACRERGGDDTIQERRDNAIFWYDYFYNHPVQTPSPALILIANKKSRPVLKNTRIIT